MSARLAPLVADVAGLTMAKIGPARLVALAALAPRAAPARAPGLALVLVAQAADPTLSGVLTRARNVLVALLVALATLQLTIAGVRYLLAAGEPEQLEKAKRGVKAAAIGYGLAALAPPLVAVLKQIVGV